MKEISFYEFLIILILSIAFTFLFIINPILKIDKNECLKEIAIKYCENNGMEYSKHYWYIGGNRFECFENERSIDAKVFRFLGNECKENSK